MSREMAKKLKGLGKTLSEGSPMLVMGFYVEMEADYWSYGSPAIAHK